MEIYLLFWVLGTCLQAVEGSRAKEVDQPWVEPEGGWRGRGGAGVAAGGRAGGRRLLKHLPHL